MAAAWAYWNGARMLAGRNDAPPSNVAARLQNRSNAAVRFSLGLPAMIAAVTAPIDVPAIQLGSSPAASKARQAPKW